MNQPKKSFEEIKSIVDRIRFMDRTFRFETLGNGFFLQVQYMEKDVETSAMELQSSRKWYISPFSTETEIVETVFKACKISMEHVVKEHFLYKSQRVYSPHFDINARIEMCEAKGFDQRIPITKDSK